LDSVARFINIQAKAAQVLPAQMMSLFLEKFLLESVGNKNPRMHTVTKKVSRKWRVWELLLALLYTISRLEALEVMRLLDLQEFGQFSLLPSWWL